MLKIASTLHGGLCTFTVIPHSVLLRMDKFQTNIIEKIKTQILYSERFLRNFYRLYEIHSFSSLSYDSSKASSKSSSPHSAI